MNWFEALVLGLIQGLTEYLPVSSSGHLAIGAYLFGIDGEDNLGFTILVHVATVMSTLVVLWKEIDWILKGLFKFQMNEETKYALNIVVSMIPVGVVGVFFKDDVEKIFGSGLLIVGCMLLVTALLLAFSYYAKPRQRENISLWHAFVIGLGQGFQPVCGFCYGAKLFPRLRQAYWFTVKVGFIFLLCCAALGWFFSPHIIGLFRNDPEVIAVGTVAFHWQLCSLPLNIFTMSGNMLTQTCRKPVAANILAAARNGLFFIPFILILPHFFGLLGVEMCQTWSDVCAFTLSVPMILHTLKNL